RLTEGGGTGPGGAVQRRRLRVHGAEAAAAPPSAGPASGRQPQRQIGDGRHDRLGQVRVQPGVVAPVQLVGGVVPIEEDGDVETLQAVEAEADGVERPEAGVGHENDVVGGYCAGEVDGVGVVVGDGRAHAASGLQEPDVDLG